MAITRARNSGIKTGVLKYDSMLGGYPPLMPAPTATAGTESASVAFTAVSGISTYRVISSPGSITATGTSSPISVTGLTGGTAYTFQIRGENAVGNGAYSAASNSVTPTLNTAFESIATATGTGSSNTITFSNIPGTYRHLQVRGIAKNNFTTNALGVGNLNITFNGVGGTSYATHTIRGDGSGVSAYGDANFSAIYPNAVANNNTANANIVGAIIIDIEDYASTTKNKTVRNFSGVDYNTNGGLVELNSGVFLSTSAITSITFTTSQNFTTQTSLALYGIKG